MGAGKTTVAEQLHARIGRPIVDIDYVVERNAGKSIPELFAEEGEDAFREQEREVAARLLRSVERYVLAFGGGAVESPLLRELLREHAFVVHLDVDVETAWERVRGSGRPLAQNEDAFRSLFERRAPLYAEVADARGRDADDVVLAAAGVHVETGALARLGELLPGGGPIALVTEPGVAGIYGADAQLALGHRLAEVHELSTGERAKTVSEVERLWRALRIDRTGTVLALGGGALTDAAGFVAATYTRGCTWVPMPTTLVGQVDAAIGGKTAIDLPEGKNLVGSFHWPDRTIVDPALLETLPQRERRNGMAEVVKTGILAGAPLWELPEAELVRRCAAYKAGICLADPYDRGIRRTLNLGHTFAHALEAAADFELPHGEAVALGLLAALRLSGRDTTAVEDVLAPSRVRVDRERAWEALLRDKKGALNLVLLRADGAFVGEQPASDVRRALDELVAE
jgi:shikimate kinase/3-dehydroquinate synthase